MRIAVLLTCYNRRATTCACLDALFRQDLPPGVRFDVFLVDDGSTDGTAEAVCERYPAVEVIPGDGTLYWGGGMRLAWSTAAAAAGYEGYLWLNDDVRLFPGSLNSLIQSAGQVSGPAIIAGSTCDPNRQLTYGGVRGTRLVEPSGTLQPCDAMYGNIVFVPGAVFRLVGNLSPEFPHLFGDQDYGFRARNAGCTIWVAPGFLGECRVNPDPLWSDPSVPLVRRWHGFHSKKWYPPRENYLFCKRHYGWRAPVRLMKLYLRVVFPGAWQRAKGVAGRT